MLLTLPTHMELWLYKVVNYYSQKAASELNGDGSSSLRSAIQRLFGRGSLEKALATASETLIPEENTALPGRVHTGLVVLNACQTGEGECMSDWKWGGH